MRPKTFNKAFESVQKIALLNGFGLHEIGHHLLTRNPVRVFLIHAIHPGRAMLNAALHACNSAYKPDNQLLSIVSRVLHRIIKVHYSVYHTRNNKTSLIICYLVSKIFLTKMPWS